MIVVEYNPPRLTTPKPSLKTKVDIEGYYLSDERSNSPSRRKTVNWAHFGHLPHTARTSTVRTIQTSSFDHEP